MKKFLIYLSSFLILFGASVAFAEVYSEDFEDLVLDSEWSADGEYEITTVPGSDSMGLHMYRACDDCGDLATVGTNTNELIYHFAADIYLTTKITENPGMDVDLMQWREGGESFELWAGFYLNPDTGNFQVFVNLWDSNDQWIHLEEFLGAYKVDDWNLLSITINDGSVTFGIDGNETNIVNESIKQPDSGFCSGRLQSKEDNVIGNSVDYYVDNLVAYTSNPAKFDYVLLGSEVRQFDPSRYSFDESSIWYNRNPYWFMITFAGTSGDPPVYPVYLEAPIYSDSSNTDPLGLVNKPDYVTNTNFSSAGFFDFLGFAPPGDLWEDKNYTFFIDANGSGEKDPDEVTRDWYIPSNSLKQMSIPQNINISRGIHPTITWDSVPDADRYMVNFYSLLPSGMVDLSVRLDTSGQITETSYTYNGDLFSDGKEYAVWVQARESHPIYRGLFFNRSGYFTKYQAADNVLESVEDWIENEELVGVGEGNSADGRLNAFVNMLENAEVLFQDGDIIGACAQLEAAYKKCDGESPPPDFVTGAAAGELMGMINQLVTDFGCQ